MRRAHETGSCKQDQKENFGRYSGIISSANRIVQYLGIVQSNLYLGIVQLAVQIRL